MSANAVQQAERPDQLEEGVRAGVRDLILALADSKRLLGMRYADWTLGAPELEAGIACASMAQDEWGHARQLYALLRDFGEDLERVEHGREPGEYASIEILDEPPAEWADLVVLNAIVDTALSVQVESLMDSSYQPLRQRCEKLLDEERFHIAHGAAWFRRMAATEGGRRALLESAARALSVVMRWYGPQERCAALVDAGVVGAGPDELRCTLAGRLGPLIELVDVKVSEAPDFDDFDAGRRRSGGSAPSPRTVEQVRGDRNRAFLMD